MATKIKRQIALFIYCFIAVCAIGFVCGFAGILISEGLYQLELCR